MTPNDSDILQLRSRNEHSAGEKYSPTSQDVPAGTKSVNPRVAARISLVIRGVHAKRGKHRACVDQLSCISSNISVILAVALPVLIAFSCANLGSFTQLEAATPIGDSKLTLYNEAAGLGNPKCLWSKTIRFDSL